MPPKLDKPPSSLTVPLLRAELAKRRIATTGMLKAELVARLTEALAAEGGEQGGGGGGDVDGDAEMVRREGRPFGFCVVLGPRFDFRAPPFDPYRALLRSWTGEVKIK